MKLIVGLGNPGADYKNTYHNLGYMAIEKAAAKAGADFGKTKCRADIAEIKIGKEKVIFAKPVTYMNLSGESVFELLRYYKIDLKDLIVIYDDYDLKAGSVRIREKGSAGTHNGMRNIISLLKSEDFARIRIGFKSEEKSNVPLIDHVLSAISEKDRPILEKSIERAASAAFDFASGEKIDLVMQRYNGDGDK